MIQCWTSSAVYWHLVASPGFASKPCWCLFVFNCVKVAILSNLYFLPLHTYSCAVLSAGVPHVKHRCHSCARIRILTAATLFHSLTFYFIFWLFFITKGWLLAVRIGQLINKNTSQPLPSFRNRFTWYLWSRDLVVGFFWGGLSVTQFVTRRARELRVWLCEVVVW